MKALYWIKDHWFVPLFILGALAGWWLTRKTGKKPPVEQIQAELRAIAAGAQARELRAQLGAKEAAEQVKKVHAESVKQLDAEQAKKAEELREDPVALSKFLVRAAR